MNVMHAKLLYQALVKGLFLDTREVSDHWDSMVAVTDTFSRMLHEAWYRTETRWGAYDRLYEVTNNILISWAIADPEADLPHGQVRPSNPDERIMLATAELYAGVAVTLQRAGLSIDDYGVLEQALRHSVRALLHDPLPELSPALRERRNALLARLVGALEGRARLSAEMETLLERFYTEETARAYGVSVRTVSDVRSERGGED